MNYNIQKYLRAKERAGKLPTVKVTKQEFIRRLIASGKTEEKAEQMALVAEGLGSVIEIGDEMVGIQEEENG
jgi:hypothetical protein